MRKPFEHADEATRVFYSRVLFNINAVRMGFYPTLLCETDDPMAGLRWRQSIPTVLAEMKKRRDEYDRGSD